jgi:hypothetical protein
VIQHLIQEKFGVLYSVYYLSQQLKNKGFSYQKTRFVSGHLWLRPGAADWALRSGTI